MFKFLKSNRTNYKKILKAFILLSLLSALLFCEHTKEDDIALAKKLHFPKEENASMSMYIRWLWYFGDKFENHKVTDSKAKKSIDSFFGNEEYIVISNVESRNLNKINPTHKTCRGKPDHIPYYTTA